ncbi:MAG: hypothetical protein M3Z15_08195, partial [Pseudomonadota bacterium]|nr:hypothetical protein [Pseudomonadota bacterium]
MTTRAAPPQRRAEAAPRPPPRKQRRKTEWLSRGFEELVQRLPQRKDLDKDPPDFDVVIVGSGYGGAIAAAELAGSVDAKGNPTRVCILERGREYLPGSFPARLSELAGHVRFSNGKIRARGECSGLFDARLGEDINALVANGLGGGSLINAGIMEEPLESVFRAPEWPVAIRSGTKAFMDMLGLAGQSLGSLKQNASGRWIENVWPDPALQKFAVLKGMGRAQFRAAKLTVATAEGRTSAN